MEQLDYSVVLPPVHKVVLPPPSQLWDYSARYAQPFHDHQQQQQQQQHHQFQYSAVTSPTASLERKQRRKRQCPDCQLWFSNLATHRAIHLQPENRPFQCHVCHRGFSRSNDLYRHGKRHWKELGNDKGAFRCPFNPVIRPAQDSQQQQQTPCHPTGVFSRCDTFKNHLKALHFEYPQGTKKKDRQGVQGRCKQCGKLFATVGEWLDLHVDTGECSLASHLTPFPA